MADEDIPLMDIHQTSRQEYLMLQEIEHWDKKLIWTAEDEAQAVLHPRKKRRRLAPVDLTEMGLVTGQNHREQTTSYGEFCSSTATTRLRELSAAGKVSKGAEVEVCGAGTARDLPWLKLVRELELFIRLREWSSVAVENFETSMKALGVGDGGITITEGDIVEEWGEPHENTLITFGSQFLMVLRPKKFREVTRLIGSTLRQSRKKGLESLAWFVHPLPGDNDKPVEWEGRMIVPSREPTEKIPYRTWGKDTTLYSEADLVAGIEKGFHGTIKCRSLGKGNHYHQKLDFLEFAPA